MKNRMLILAVMLAGCTTSAVPANPKQPAVFETGKATLTDVEQVLGEPNVSTVKAGRKTACYRYAGRLTVPESFIRIVGSSSREADLTCCFRFAPDGVLTGTTSRLDQINSALKLAAMNGGKTEKPACPPPLLTPETVVHLPLNAGW